MFSSLIPILRLARNHVNKYNKIQNPIVVYKSRNSCMSNTTYVVLLIAWGITHRSTLAVPISSTLAFDHTQDNPSYIISGIRTLTIDLVSIFMMDLGFGEAIPTWIGVALFSEDRVLKLFSFFETLII